MTIRNVFFYYDINLTTRPSTHRVVEKQHRRAASQPQRLLDQRRAKHQLGHLLACRHHAVAAAMQITCRRQHKGIQRWAKGWG